MGKIQLFISYLSLLLMLSLVSCQLTYGQNSYNRSTHGKLYPDYSQGGYNQSAHGKLYPDYSQGGYNQSAHGQLYPDYSQKNNYKPHYGQQRYYYNAPFGAPGYGTPYGASGFRSPVPFKYGNGFYTMTSPTATYQFWKAPSGYYYPWYNYRGANPPYGYGVATSFNQGNIQAQQLELTTVYQDLGKFLLQAKTEGKLQENDYTHLNRRLNDLVSKTNSLRFQEGGTLSETTEEDLRTDLDNLSKEVSGRLR